MHRAFAIALLLAPVPALAQGAFQPVGQSDADALAEQMRRLGSNPLDLNALLTAGEISIRLEDYSAAGAFFTRAEKIDPRSARAKAGEGAILVHSERPAESLRYFAQAEQYGLAPARFASERGLAYDLLGDPGRAQRDYRLAQSTRDDPETRRRYALSLAIAGRQAQALDQLAPLIRQNDRAAWRTRAFVLAMGGNAPEALRIAQTMMPPGAASSLAQFFNELPRLPAIDRAFAVHFGEVRPTPQRLADARLAPRDAPLALEPLPVQVAAVTAGPATTRRDRRDRRDRRRREQTQVAAVVPAPVPQPVAQPPAYQAPAYVAPVATTPVRDRPLSSGELASLAAAGNRGPSRRSSRTPPVNVPATAARPLTPAEQASLAAATLRPSGSRRDVAVAPRQEIAAALPPVQRTPLLVPTAPRPTQASATTPAPRQETAATVTPVQRTPVPATTTPPVAAGNLPNLFTLPAAAQPGATAPLPAPATGSAPIAPAVSPALTGPVSGASAATVPSLTQTAAVVPSATSATSGAAIPAAVEGGAQAAAPAALAGTAPAPSTPPADTAPTPGFASTAIAPLDAASGGAEAAVERTPVPTALTTVAPVSATPAPVTASVAPSPAPIATSTPPAPLVVTPPAAAPRTPVRRAGRAQTDAVLARIVAGLSIPATELDVAGPARATPGQAAPTAAERRAAERRQAAERKAIADRKAAAEAKAQADREAAEERRAARAEPARIWVQVAGGANEGDLARAWANARTRAPDAFAGRQGWTTPLRATNRVLAGPFKTQAEARSFVNQLSKAGVSAFTFTSEAGQKVTRLTSR